ncbi:hypothetical protein LCGC14_0147010 [marine sediment metagenome]|uniref:Uncharacterized protein n=1 Tax=marine sediment metagenome TaxID=412755 RepID=A0A0F9V3L3_9ZZZZ
MVSLVSTSTTSSLHNDSDNLKSIGEKAKDIAIATGAALNDSIIQAVGDTKLNPQELRRVIESANKSTFSHMFSAEADKTFEFPLASFDGVNGALEKNLKAPGVKPLEASPSKDRPWTPSAEKDDKDMEMLFSGVGKDDGNKTVEYEKTASARTASVTLSDLNRAENLLDNKVREVDNYYYDAVEDFYKEAKSHILDHNGSVFDVAAAMNSVDPSVAKEYFPIVLSKLASNKVIRKDKLIKEAGSVEDDFILQEVNPEHPLVMKFNSLVKLAYSKLFFMNSKRQIKDAKTYVLDRIRGL